MLKWTTSAFASALAAGCKSTEEKAAAPVEEGAPTVTAPAAGSGTTTSGVSTAGVSGAPGGPYSAAALKDPNNILSRRSVYFDFDSNLVKDEYRPLVTAHARYLQQNPGAKMRIEGNADERGSREYNIALGQRRSEAVKQTMQLLGARPDQIESVSFGEEKPRATGHDEKSWAENRRADIVYQGE